MCVTSAHVIVIIGEAIEEAFRELAISSLNAQKPTSADIGISPDTVRLKPSAKLSRKRLVFECKYDQNV